MKIGYLFLLLIVFTSCKQKEHKHNTNFTTKTGKTIIVNETHLDSESLVSIEINATDFDNGNHFVLKEIDPISFIELSDLDNNGFDELYIVTKPAGSGSYLNVIGYASNNDKSLSPIYFPELTNKNFDKGGLFEGYMGHDSFFFDDSKLIRQFPIYKDEDTNNNPTGGTKEISYQLIKGEASWRLEVQ